MTEALTGVEVRDAGGKEEIETEGDQESGYQPGGEGAANLADEDHATSSTYEGATEGKCSRVEVDESLAQEMGACGGRPKDPLGLIGGQCIQGSQARPQQSRQGDKSTTTRDGVNHSRRECQKEEEYFGCQGLVTRNLN